MSFAESSSSACVPVCGQRICGDNGCGGNCGTCAGENSCVEGRCACQQTDNTICFEGDVHYQDACGAPHELLEACPGGCSNGACIPICDALDTYQHQADDHVLIPPWQTFVPHHTGLLTQIDMRPNQYAPVEGTISGTLSVYAGPGVAGPRLHQQPYSLPSVGGGPWASFILTAQVPVEAGVMYTWELTGANGLFYATSNIYPDGYASDGRWDMVFRIYVGECR